MLSERQLEALLGIFEDRARAVTTAYLTAMGEHLKDIGRLIPSDVHRLIELKRMGANVDWVKGEIAKAAGLAAQDIEKVLYRVAESDYRFAAKYYGEARQVPLKQNAALMRILKAQARQTAGDMSNLSRSSVVSTAYKEAVSRAVQAAQTGVGDYNSAIRRAVKVAGREGLRVAYESGRTRRLDSALRMNVLDGIRNLNQDVALQTGKEFRADGVELSAHALCAPDHLPYQGLQFTDRQFAQIQAALERPIGCWNCKHFAYPILQGISKPAYTQAQLDDFKRNSEQLIEIDGRRLTRYEWTQEQRRLETAIRQQKDVAVLAAASGDDVLRRDAQERIHQYQNSYRRISGQAGLNQRFDKTRVDGFRDVKSWDEMSDAEKYKGAVFESENLLARHLDKHLAEYGDITQTEYIARAEKLLRAKASDDILSLTRSDGSVAKYRVSTNEFAVGTRKGLIRTAFKPKDGYDYWRKELERNG